ncbi:MAG: MFS transporter, partial [Ruegeria sp.]
SFAAVPKLNTPAEPKGLGYGATARMGTAGTLWGTPVLLAILWRPGEAEMLTAVIGFYAAAIGVHLWLAQQRKVAA